MDLGELAGDGHAQCGAADGFEVGEGVEYPVRGFVENEGAFVRGSSAASVSKRLRRAPAFSGRKSDGSGIRSARRPLATRALRAALAPGMGMTGTPAAMAAEMRPGAGIADAGHAGIGDESDAGAGPEGFDELGGAMALVVPMAAYGGGCDLKVVEQLLGLAGVFAGDAVSAPKDVKGAEGDVAEVADGSGDEVEAGR